MMVVDTKHKEGDIVYLKTDIDQKQRIVTGFIIRGNTVYYQLSCGIEETTHYDYEISLTKDVLMDS